MWHTPKGQPSFQNLKRIAFVTKFEEMIFMMDSEMIALMASCEQIAMWRIIIKLSMAYFKEIFLVMGSERN